MKWHRLPSRESVSCLIWTLRIRFIFFDLYSLYPRNWCAQFWFVMVGMRASSKMQNTVHLRCNASITSFGAVFELQCHYTSKFDSKCPRARHRSLRKATQTLATFDVSDNFAKTITLMHERSSVIIHIMIGCVVLIDTTFTDEKLRDPNANRSTTGCEYILLWIDHSSTPQSKRSNETKIFAPSQHFWPLLSFFLIARYIYQRGDITTWSAHSSTNMETFRNYV